jgi:DNA modification methylase
MTLEFERYRALRREGVSMLAELPDRSVDAFVTDPPYGIEMNLHTLPGRDCRIAGDGRAEARALWRAWIPQAFRVAKDNTAHVVFGTYKSPWMFDLLNSCFRVKGCIVWDKRRMGLGYHLRQQWEMAYFVVKGRPPVRDNAVRDVWSITKLTKPAHPCQKPVELLQRAIRLVSDPGMLICDPFAGVFSTGVAAMAERRRFIGSEIDVRHYRLGLKRIKEAINET